MTFRILRQKLVFIASLMLAASTAVADTIIVVAKSGGDFTNPVDAMASIFDASRANPYVVFVKPGVYRLGATPLYLKDHVSLVGAGQKATRIVGSVNSAALIPDGGPGVVNGANHSEIRNLTVVNRYPGTAHAIHNLGASVLISQVTAIARGGGGSGAFKAAIWNDVGSRVRMEHVTARAVGDAVTSPCIGLYNRGSLTRVHGGRIVATSCGLINNGIAVSEGGGGVFVDGAGIVAQSSGGFNNGVIVTAQSGLAAHAEVRGSAIEGFVSAANVDSSGSSATIKIASSSIYGSVGSAVFPAEIKCVGAFDADFNPLGTDCMP